DLWKRWSPFVEQAIAAPKNIGWRARETLVDWWRHEAHREALKNVDDIAADRYGCVRNIRLSGPFGRNSAADTLRAFPPEKPGPWPQRFPSESVASEAPRI